MKQKFKTKTVQFQNIFTLPLPQQKGMEFPGGGGP